MGWKMLLRMRREKQVLCASLIFQVSGYWAWESIFRERQANRGVSENCARGWLLVEEWE